jgi:hypothetical protein
MMLDELDKQTLAEIRDVVGAVNAEAVEIILTYEWLPTSDVARFSPGTLLCWDVDWIAPGPIVGRAYYDPDGWDVEVIATPWGCRLEGPRRIRRRAHFPDYIVWRVERHAKATTGIA